MQFKGSIRAVNSRIRDFVSSRSDCRTIPVQQAFAKQKLAAKFEEPRRGAELERRKAAWERWIQFDEGMSDLKDRILGPQWAKARLFVHELLSDFRLGPLTFTNGSSFEPRGPRLSISCKLVDTWDITSDCFDVFAAMSYRHRALKHAVKKRFTNYCKSKHYSERAINRRLWGRFSTCTDPAFQIYKFKLFSTVRFVQGNRWSTVPKNNLKDRSICLEPFCNMLVQRAVGLGLRTCLKDKLGIDLDHLADVHRNRISDNKVATIDLSDCSDAISLRLVEYLVPARVFRRICECRSDMTLGPDGMYYIPEKVSSMGNGFTFDLMTIVLTALTRAYDNESTVFGDDIIVDADCAEGIIADLSLAGFRVNLEKTNVRTGYRESCGAHFMDGYGYLTAFDLRWLKTPHDLIVCLNKVAILAHVYGGPFENLRQSLWACAPRHLLGAAILRHIANKDRPPSYELDTFVRYGPLVAVQPDHKPLKLIRRAMKRLQLQGDISVAQAVVVTQAPAPTRLGSSDWDLFFQWIQSARLTRRVPRLVTKSTLVVRVGEDQIGLISSLRR